ncbi:MAG TPA: DUF2892 domain-containing protein [Lentimicrobium sp.]|nr:DUF2892 domain-containing protein [Lentimicrobium sp.]
MKKNLGITDRIIRIIISAIVAVLYFNHTITGTLGILLIAAAGILFITSLVSFCPLYALLGIKSCPVKSEN